MSETVKISMNNRFEAEIQAADPQEEQAESLAPVSQLHELSPYGMLLAGLGSCTAMVIHTYASHRQMALEQVEILLRYERKFQEDCENCEKIDQYRENITEEIGFRGELSAEEQQKLLVVARQCPIHKMLENSITIDSRLGEVPISSARQTG